MATNHTENYNLNLWEANDNFVREEFNENTNKIDAAIKAETNARAAADTAISTTLAGVVKFASGTYIGNDAETRIISTGFTPKAVLIFDRAGYSSFGSYYYGGMAVTDSPVRPGNNAAMIEVVTEGFKLTQHSASGNTLPNRSGNHYNYIAFG